MQVQNIMKILIFWNSVWKETFLSPLQHSFTVRNFFVSIALFFITGKFSPKFLIANAQDFSSDLSNLWKTFNLKKTYLDAAFAGGGEAGAAVVPTTGTASFFIAGAEDEADDKLWRIPRPLLAATRAAWSSLAFLLLCSLASSSWV